MKIVITGIAGLVGQNLVARLSAREGTSVSGLDKHARNVATFRQLHPGVSVIEQDLSKPGNWTEEFRGCDVLIHNHAQIGGLAYQPFHANNIVATERVLEAAARHRVPYVIHISSSVVNSMATDFYTETKKAQERLVLESGLPCCVLRPTLMFGWFDRKHMGWLARFMRRVPVFPIPGTGDYLRQPLYVGDMCAVIISAIDRPRPGAVFNISGQVKVTYLELIRELRRACGAKASIVRIPYGLFHALLQVYAWVDRDPPFTSRQLKALVTPDVFEVIDWPSLFAVQATPLQQALHETFNHPQYSAVELEF